jgi:hypothetical protein
VPTIASAMASAWVRRVACRCCNRCFLTDSGVSSLEPPLACQDERCR